MGVARASCKVTAYRNARDIVQADPRLQTLISEVATSVIVFTSQSRLLDLGSDRRSLEVALICRP